MLAVRSMPPAHQLAVRTYSPQARQTFGKRIFPPNNTNVTLSGWGKSAERSAGSPSDCHHLADSATPLRAIESITRSMLFGHYFDRLRAKSVGEPTRNLAAHPVKLPFGAICLSSSGHRAC